VLPRYLLHLPDYGNFTDINSSDMACLRFVHWLRVYSRNTYDQVHAYLVVNANGFACAGIALPSNR
jgi:hypothetical protein